MTFLLNFLLICDTRPYEWGTHWNLNSQVKVCKSSFLNITSLEAPIEIYLAFCVDVTQEQMNGTTKETRIHWW